MLDERSPVLRLAPYVVVHDAEPNHDARHQHAIIHVFGRRRRRRRPETPKENEEDVEAREDVVDYAEKARYAPWAPLEGGLDDIIVSGRRTNRLRDWWVGVVVILGVVGVDLSGCVAPEEEGAGNQVGEVETGCAEGDEIFKDGGGTYVDESEETGDRHDQGYRDHGNRSPWFDLDEWLGKWVRRSGDGSRRALLM